MMLRTHEWGIVRVHTRVVSFAILLFSTSITYTSINACYMRDIVFQTKTLLRWHVHLIRDKKIQYYHYKRLVWVTYYFEELQDYICPYCKKSF